MRPSGDTANAPGRVAFTMRRYFEISALVSGVIAIGVLEGGAALGAQAASSREGVRMAAAIVLM